MENKNELIEIKPKNMYTSICIAQAVCIAVILIALFIIKIFFKDNYQKITNWCEKTVFDDIKITAFIEEEIST